jgi:hypothetical protein
MSGFHRNNDDFEDECGNQQRRKSHKDGPNMRQESGVQASTSNHQNSICSASNQDDGPETSIKVPNRKLKDKEEAKMKKYLIKIFEKMQENQGSIHSMNESPDPLNEHANSVHDHLFKKDNQSSLSEIANPQNCGSNIASDKSKNKSKDPTSGSTSNNGTGRHRKLQFHTSSNFFPSS